MTATVPQIEPDRVIAGDTWRWDKDVADYLASDGWTLKYSLRGIAAIDFDATANGSGYSVTVAASKTLVPEGVYVWTARVEKAGEVHTVDEGTLFVAANLATTKAGAKQGFAEAVLPKIEAVLANRASSDILEYQIAGRMLKKWTPEQLMKLRTQLRTELARKRTKGKSAQARVRFGAR